MSFIVRISRNEHSTNNMTVAYTHVELLTGFFFFFLGPVCIRSGSTAAFKAYCAYTDRLTYKTNAKRALTDHRAGQGIINWLHGAG
jgi:hypothetical protein